MYEGRLLYHFDKACRMLDDSSTIVRHRVACLESLVSCDTACRMQGVYGISLPHAFGFLYL